VRRVPGTERTPASGTHLESTLRYEEVALAFDDEPAAESPTFEAHALPSDPSALAALPLVEGDDALGLRSDAPADLASPGPLVAATPGALLEPPATRDAEPLPVAVANAPAASRSSQRKWRAPVLALVALLLAASVAAFIAMHAR
jgi:hypothetical protein